MKARVFRSLDKNPHRNLAREEALLLGISSNEIFLFLWQNDKTVVIGRNQNAWRECNTSLLTQEGGLLARRTTGGGAVFHDTGNVNFSFIMPRMQYDLPKQLRLIQNAVRSFGIDCAFSGRNDLIANDRKFSGNAFRFTRDAALHHGTLMVNVDPSMLSRYLQVSKEKLLTRSIQSVSSRIVNLSTLADITVESLITAVQQAFCCMYGDAPIEMTDDSKLEGFDSLVQRNASWGWNYGETPTFDASFTHRFHWGSVELLLTLTEGNITACTVYTDAMDANLSTDLQSALTGCPFTANDMAARTTGDISKWLGALSI